MEITMIIEVKDKMHNWKKCWSQTWDDIKNEGWEFLGVNHNGSILMIKLGYINEFRQVRVEQ